MESSKKSILLTFDDGPNPKVTPLILDILSRYNARATFFVLGRNVELWPELAKRIVAEGHAIGNHSFSHSFWKTLTGNLQDEARLTDDAIYKATGVKTKLYRPPWGHVATKALKNFLQKNYSIFLWDISAYDWFRPSPTFIEKTIIRKVTPGCIVLLHDGSGQSLKGDRSHTAEALPGIIEALQQQGYVFETLAEVR